MEILLAIVWYLSLLTPGNYYDEVAIYDIAVDNSTAVDYVVENHLTEAVDFYNTFDPEDGGVYLPAYWDKEPVDHTDESLWEYDPWNPRDPRGDQDSTESTGNQSSGGTDDGGNN